jgi:hypothetical protein
MFTDETNKTRKHVTWWDEQIPIDASKEEAADKVVEKGTSRATTTELSDRSMVRRATIPGSEPPVALGGLRTKATNGQSVKLAIRRCITLVDAPAWETYENTTNADEHVGVSPRSSSISDPTPN